MQKAAELVSSRLNSRCLSRYGVFFFLVGTFLPGSQLGWCVRHVFFFSFSFEVGNGTVNLLNSIILYDKLGFCKLSISVRVCSEVVNVTLTRSLAGLSALVYFVFTLSCKTFTRAISTIYFFSQLWN
ncbi:hypothetical protein F2P56_013823, partial [Juglans regia]